MVETHKIMIILQFILPCLAAACDSEKIREEKRREEGDGDREMGEATEPALWLLTWLRCDASQPLFLASRSYSRHVAR